MTHDDISAVCLEGEFTLWARGPKSFRHWRCKAIGAEEIVRKLAEALKPSLEVLILPPNELPLLAISADEFDIGGSE